MDILADFKPEVRALADRLRQIILATVPEATGAANPGWRSFNYRHPAVGYFCGMFPEPDGVKLAFEFGVLLPDPRHLLEGDGKQVRYVNIQVGEEIPVHAIRELLLSAIRLPEKRAERLWMVRSGARLSEDDGD